MLKTTRRAALGAISAATLALTVAPSMAATQRFDFDLRANTEATP